MTAPKPSSAGVDARRAALRFLDRVLRTGQTLEAAAAGTSGLPAPDHALALAIAGETLRRIPELDALIDSATRQALPGDSKARMVLRLALAQKLAMHVPDHALVATALPLVDGGPRRLVHGVLGTLLRRQVTADEQTPLPAAVEERWEAAWGGEVVAAARRQILARPPLDLSFADDAAAQAFATANDGVSLAPRHVRLASTSVVDLPDFAGPGASWWVQDLAASLPARLVPAGAGSVLDACSAPGGKTMQLAAAGHRVVALDRSRSRLDRLSDNLARTHLAAETLVADLLQWRPPQPFDAILFDAPCTATGTFRRHPEVLHRVRAPYIRDMAGQQRALLDRAADWLRPGGTLVYSVCSLEPEEGEQIVDAFLGGRPDYAVDAPAGMPDFVTPTAAGHVRILPGLLESEGGLDGFFAARLVRRA